MLQFRNYLWLNIFVGIKMLILFLFVVTLFFICCLHTYGYLQIVMVYKVLNLWDVYQTHSKITCAHKSFIFCAHASDRNDETKRKTIMFRYSEMINNCMPLISNLLDTIRSLVRMKPRRKKYINSHQIFYIAIIVINLHVVCLLIL